MRVLLDCRMAGWSGVGRYSTALARALAARGDVDLVQVHAAGRPAPVTGDSGVETVSASGHPFGIRGALELGRIVGRTKPNLVHCLHFPTPIPTRRPLVVTVHDLIPLLMPGVMPSALRRFVYRRWNARAVGVADRVIVPSQATAEDVRRLYPDAGSKLVITPEAADDFSSGPIGPLTTAVTRLTSAPYIMSMANTKPHKDLPTLLRAFTELAPSRPELGLLLVGAETSGYLDKALAGVPSAVRGRVAFTGRVSDAELRALYAGASAFVFPSRREGFGLPPLEAMVLGTPVVCADAAAVLEVVGEAALSFPAGDAEALKMALASVLDSGPLQDRLSSAGREQAAQFSWQRTAALTVSVYQEAMHDHGQGQAGGTGAS